MSPGDDMHVRRPNLQCSVSSPFSTSRLALVLALTGALYGCPPKVDADGNPVTVGRVRLRTFPAGAKVWIDGELKVESTPATLILKPNVYQLKLQLEGGEAVHRKIEIKAGDVETIEVKLPKPEPSTITVLSDVEGAKVRINGYTRGYTPLMKARTLPGRIDITVSDPISKRAKSSHVELAIAEQKIVEVFFTEVTSEEEPPPKKKSPMSVPPPRGFLTLGLKPDGKVFDADGGLLGDTPLVSHGIEKGEHELTLESLDGQYRKTVTIEVEPNKKAIYRFRFQDADRVPNWKPKKPSKDAG